MTTSSYLAAFGLRAPPFSKEIDDADLWLPASKVGLLDDIEDAIAERQSILLIGEPGVGKTCVLRALRKRLPEAGFRLTYCRNVNLGKRDFYRLLCSSLGLTPSSTAANLFLAVEAYVGDLRRDKIHPVFLLDEAHLLQPDLMAHLHILLNYEWDASALLSLVLIGLPELESHLARRTNRSLLTRIHHRFLIDSASVDDTAEYVRYRLGAAGAAHTLFPDDAVAELHACSQGSLREIDRIATMSLRDAARRKKKLVDRDLVVRAAQILVRDE